METYERYQLFHLQYSFYPTYEEWKRMKNTIAANALRAFYPTYEEWKQLTTKNNNNSILLFLSYL